MTCAEFQKVLPYIIESGGNPEEEQHLQTCKVCSDLVTDLRYIAEQAKLLVPMEDPSPKVWNGIQESLEREGIVKPGSKNPAGSRKLQRNASSMKIGVKVTSVGILGLATLLVVGRYCLNTVAHADSAAIHSTSR